jgi:hypothetical protein
VLLATVASAVIVVSHDHSPCCCWLHPYIGFASPLSEAVWTTDLLVLYCRD